MNRRFAWPLLSGTLVALLSACDSQNTADATAEYLLTAARPNHLHIVNMQTHKVARSCELPGGPSPGTVVMSPDKTIAYVLNNHFSDVYGIRIDDCELVFSTQQSNANIRVKSMASIALSPDGAELYTHQTRVRLLLDHYEVLDTQMAVFNTAAGLEAQATRTFDAPRQITTMDTLASGEVILGGGDIYGINPHSGKLRVLLPSRSVNDPQYAPRDVLTVWPLGPINNEFIRLYSTARYKGEPGDLDNADWLWGYERIDLNSGETEARTFGPLTSVLFTGVRRPGQLNKVYGTLNHLKEFDASTEQETRSVDLEHTYYCINFSTDGSRIYLSGALNDIAVYDADSFEKLATIELDGDVAVANSVVFRRSPLSTDS